MKVLDAVFIAHCCIHIRKEDSILKENGALKIPLPLLVLDLLGAIVLGLGLAEWFANTNIMPVQFQFENYYIVMVICGGLLMFPLILHIVKSALARGRQR
jgi:uncharacterized membrane protein YidH (DUF202 family)